MTEAPEKDLIKTKILIPTITLEFNFDKFVINKEKHHIYEEALHEAGVLMSDDDVTVNFFYPIGSSHKSISDEIGIPYTRYNFMLKNNVDLFNITVSKKLEEINCVLDAHVFVNPVSDYGYIDTVKSV